MLSATPFTYMPVTAERRDRGYAAQDVLSKIRGHDDDEMIEMMNEPPKLQAADEDASHAPSNLNIFAAELTLALQVRCPPSPTLLIYNRAAVRPDAGVGLRCHRQRGSAYAAHVAARAKAHASPFAADVIIAPPAFLPSRAAILRGRRILQYRTLC